MRMGIKLAATKFIHTEFWPMTAVINSIVFWKYVVVRSTNVEFFCDVIKTNVGRLTESDLYSLLEMYNAVQLTWQSNNNPQQISNEIV